MTGEKATPGAHFLEKHGKQTTLASQLERLQTARNPTTEIVEYFTSGPRAGDPKRPPAAINPAIKYTKSCCVDDTWMPEIRTDSLRA